MRAPRGNLLSSGTKWSGCRVRSVAPMSEPRPRPLVVRPNQNRSGMMLGTIVIIILVLALIGALPTWGHSRNWGYAPSGGLGLIVLILIILLLLGRL